MKSSNAFKETIKEYLGLNNNPTIYNKKIVALIKKSLPEIRKIVIKTRPRGKQKAAA